MNWVTLGRAVSLQTSEFFAQAAIPLKYIVLDWVRVCCAQVCFPSKKCTPAAHFFHLKETGKLSIVGWQILNVVHIMKVTTCTNCWCSFGTECSSYWNVSVRLALADLWQMILLSLAEQSEIQILFFSHSKEPCAGIMASRQVELEEISYIDKSKELLDCEKA